MKDPFNVQEERCDFPQDTAVPHLAWMVDLIFLELLQVPLELQQGPQGTTPVASGKTSVHASCEGPLGIPLQSVSGPKSSSGAQAGH